MLWNVDVNVSSPIVRVNGASSECKRKDITNISLQKNESLSFRYKINQEQYSIQYVQLSSTRLQLNLSYELKM